MDKPTVGRRISERALGALALGLLVSACAGENLFSLAASVAPVGPGVTITAPSEGFTISVGDSVLVLADVNAPDGATSATLSGHYDGAESEAAYESFTDNNLGGAIAPNIVEYLQPAEGQVAGPVYIVVSVTDATGVVGTDSVKITIIG